MHQEMPSIAASTYSSSSVDPLAAIGLVAPPLDRRIFGDQNMALKMLANPINQAINQGNQVTSTARIVKVFIADPNENLPLDKRVLYSGEERLTDLTDQELFFEVPIKELLDKHNSDTRTKTADKKASEKAGRDVFLEPIRIRDLKMVVVTVAQF